MCASPHLLWIEEISHVQATRSNSPDELDALPLHGLDLIGKPLDAQSPQTAASVCRTALLCFFNPRFGCQSPGSSFRFQSQVEPLFWIHIVIFQVLTGQPRIIPTDPLLTHEGLEQPLFGDPIQLPDELGAVLGQQAQGLGPFSQ